MWFNGVHASSFEHAKATSWRNSFYTDFDRKEITYRGVVRAAVEVPTVRKIEVDFLVKGRNAREIEKKLVSMAQWLQSAGTSKLLSDRDPNNYFKARCTTISKPQFSGLSARFTATFTCADYKLYSVRTDLPNGEQNVDTCNFSFAYKHCLNQMGVIFVEESRDAVPEVRANKYDISGRSGTLRYPTDNPILAEREVTGTLYLVNQADASGLMSDEAIAKKLHAVASWLVNAGRSTLVFDNDTMMEYEAEVISAIPYSRTGWENGTLKVKFVVQPLCKNRLLSYLDGQYSIDYTGSLILSLLPMFTDGIGFRTPLNFSVTNNGISSITSVQMNYYTTSYSWKEMRLGNGFYLSPGATLAVNSDAGTILSTPGGDSMRYLWGDFPYITPESERKAVFMFAGATSVNVKIWASTRWL